MENWSSQSRKSQKQKQLLNSKILNKILKNKKNYNFKGIAIDSREVRKGDLFIAIKGKNKDGNTFIPNALKKGASVVIASGKRKKNRINLISISNPKNFLNNFAELKRKYCNAKVLAITGSVGKTSLKSMLRNLLQKFGKTYVNIFINRIKIREI